MDFDNLTYDGHSGILAEIAYDVMISDESLSPFFRFESLNMKRSANDEKANHDDIITFGLNYKPVGQVVFKADYLISQSKLAGSESTNTISLGAGYMF